MKGPSMRNRMLFFALTLCFGLAVGWAMWRGRASAAAAPTAGLLESLPRASGNSLADRAIAQWAGKARRDPGSSAAWANLGDALMQKARETLDSGYYRQAEAV